MKKQTAVSIIIENFNLLSDNDFKTWFLNSMEKLEALEKEQIMNAHKDNAVVYEMDANGQAEQYYNENYNK